MPNVAFDDLMPEAQAVRNRVMRNTYWLLAASLLPTILGAWAGVAFNLGALLTGSPILSLIGFLVIAFGFIFAIKATQHSGMGIIVLLAFTFFMGLVLSPLITTILGFSNGVTLIALAAGGTAAIFAIMGVVASTIKRDISGWSKFLFIGLLGLIIAGIANIFLQLSVLALTLSTIAVFLFSVYLIFDLKLVIDGGETNYISATLAIYLDLINIFQSLLVLFGIFGDDD